MSKATEVQDIHESKYNGTESVQLKGRNVLYNCCEMQSIKFSEKIIGGGNWSGLNLSNWTTYEVQTWHTLHPNMSYLHNLISYSRWPTVRMDNAGILFFLVRSLFVCPNAVDKHPEKVVRKPKLNDHTNSMTVHPWPSSRYRHSLNGAKLMSLRQGLDAIYDILNSLSNWMCLLPTLIVSMSYYFLLHTRPRTKIFLIFFLQCLQQFICKKTSKSPMGTSRFMYVLPHSQRLFVISIHTQGGFVSEKIKKSRATL